MNQSAQRLTMFATLLAVTSVAATACTPPATATKTAPTTTAPATTAPATTSPATTTSAKTTPGKSAGTPTAAATTAASVPRTRTLTLNSFGSGGSMIVILETGTQTPDKSTFIAHASFLRDGKIYDSMGAMTITLDQFSKMTADSALQVVTQAQQSSLQSRVNDPDPSIAQPSQWGLAHAGVFLPYVVKITSAGTASANPTESICYAVPTYVTVDHKPFRCLDFDQKTPVTTLQVNSATYFSVGQPTTSVLNSTPERAEMQLPTDASFGWDKPGDAGVLVDPSDSEIAKALEGK